jgi:hypothetical protein
MTDIADCETDALWGSGALGDQNVKFGDKTQRRLDLQYTDCLTDTMEARHCRL